MYSNTKATKKMITVKIYFLGFFQTSIIVFLFVIGNFFSNKYDKKTSNVVIINNSTTNFTV